MITRGHYIGEILDELAGIMTEVEMRTSHGLMDLPVHAENFCRDILKPILGGAFQNLNFDHPNTPALDLGSAALRIAIQVTASNTSKKVNDTLATITDEQRITYDRFIVLMLVKRQQSYTLQPDLVAKNNFSERDIWDLRDVAKAAVDLPIDRLQALHAEIRAQTVRLKFELEVRPVGGHLSRMNTLNGRCVRAQ